MQFLRRSGIENTGLFYLYCGIFESYKFLKEVMKFRPSLGYQQSSQKWWHRNWLGHLWWLFTSTSNKAFSMTSGKFPKNLYQQFLPFLRFAKLIKLRISSCLETKGYLTYWQYACCWCKSNNTWSWQSISCCYVLLWSDKGFW